MLLKILILKKQFNLTWTWNRNWLQQSPSLVFIGFWRNIKDIGAKYIWNIVSDIRHKMIRNELQKIKSIFSISFFLIRKTGRYNFISMIIYVLKSHFKEFLLWIFKQAILLSSGIRKKITVTIVLHYGTPKIQKIRKIRELDWKIF